MCVDDGEGRDMSWLLKKLFRNLIVFYSCICLIGCATSRAFEYAKENGEMRIQDWSVDAVTFAAIRDNRHIRVCVELSSPTDKTVTQLNIDLLEMSKQLSSQEAVIGGLKDGLNTEASLCSRLLEVDEKRLPVSVVYSDALNIDEALRSLQQKPLDELTVFMLHHETESYLVFGAPAGMYQSLDHYAFETYTDVEQHYHPSIFLLMPLTLVIDVAMIALIIPCVIPIFWPICLPVAMVAGIIDDADPESYKEDPATAEEALFE